MADKKEIRIDHNKKGKKMAYYRSRRQIRDFRMKLADAEMAISTGNASSITWGPSMWKAGVGIMREWVDANGVQNYETSYTLQLVRA